MGLTGVWGQLLEEVSTPEQADAMGCDIHIILPHLFFLVQWLYLTSPPLEGTFFC